MCQCRVLRTCFTNPALDLLELSRERRQRVRSCHRFGLLFPAETRLLLRLPRNESLQFALALEQGRVDAATDLRAGFMEELQQRARAASLARGQCCSSKA